MKFLKQPVYIRYVIAKLLRFCRNLQTHLLRFLFTEDFFNITKSLVLVSGTQFSYFPIFLLQYCINWPMSLPECVYFPSYSAKRVSCFMLKYLMTSWYLNIWKVKIWLSQEWKELLKWNKHFSLFYKCSVLYFSKNVADTNFKPSTLI